MNEVMKMCIEPFLTGFDNYEIENDKLKEEIEDFKRRLVNLTDGYEDSIRFFIAFQSSGMQDEYAELQRKAKKL